MARTADTDADWVKRARKGDLNAVERLIARHRGRLLSIARQITQDSEAAQDVAQDALVQAVQSLHTLRDGQRFGQWLNTIVRRQGQRWLRDGDRNPEPLGEVVLRGVPRGAWVAQEAPEEVVQRIRDALSILTQRERRITVLHYLEGYTCDEIAAKLGMAPGSVKRLLYNSRRKVRQECATMAAAEDSKKGPRQLRVWIDGNVPPGYGNVFDHLRPRLAQAACLAVNTGPKTAQQVADQVQAHVGYVEEMLADLVDMTVLVRPSRGRYLASFIAFDGEDWRRLMRVVPEPAAQAAKRFAEAEPRLRAAFGRTSLAARGWSWEDVIWVVYAVLVANMAVVRCAGVGHLRPQPTRPGGGYYWLGGYEVVPGLPSVWTTGLNSSLSSPTFQVGHFWTWQIEREQVAAASRTEDRGAILELVAEQAHTEEEILSRLGADAESLRGALADLVRMGIVRRGNGRYTMAVPVFGTADSDVLAPEIDALVKPVVADIVIPALRDVDSQLNDMGYGHCREQYPEWHAWLAHDITGEALRYLTEQEVLKRPPDPAPPNFATLAWRRGIALLW